MEERVEKQDSDAKRSLVIILNGEVPTFDFSGHWTGKNISTITRLIPKKYQRYLRDQRLNTRRNDERS